MSYKVLSKFLFELSINAVKFMFKQSNVLKFTPVIDYLSLFSNFKNF